MPGLGPNVSAADFSGAMAVLQALGDATRDPAATRAMLKDWADTLAAAKAERAQAQELARQAEADHVEADEMRLEAEALAAKTKTAMAARQAELDARAKTLEAAFAKLAVEQTRFEQARIAFETDASTRMRDIAARSADIDARMTALSQAEHDVAVLRTDLQGRLDRIKAAAA